MIALALALTLQSSPTPAERMQDIVRLESAVEICDRAGYAPVAGAAEIEASKLAADLEGAGYSPQRIDDLKEDARRVEGNRLAQAFDLPRGIENDETRRIAKEARSFVFQQCARAKADFPTAFAESEDEGRIFNAQIGLWLDYPLIEEVEFYLVARGGCASSLPAFDARDAAERLTRPFAAEPSTAVAALQNYYVRAYREGLDMGPELDATQCRRLMRRADQALTEAWASHFGGRPPYGPLS